MRDPFIGKNPPGDVVLESAVAAELEADITSSSLTENHYKVAVNEAVQAALQNPDQLDRWEQVINLIIDFYRPDAIERVRSDIYTLAQTILLNIESEPLTRDMYPVLDLSVLDLGCGNNEGFYSSPGSEGRYEPWIPRILTSVVREVVGVDAVASGDEPFEFLRIDLSQRDCLAPLYSVGRTFDVVHLSQAFMEVSEDHEVLKNLLREISKVLSPNGVLMTGVGSDLQGICDVLGIDFPWFESLPAARLRSLLVEE